MSEAVEGEECRRSWMTITLVVDIAMSLAGVVSAHDRRHGQKTGT